MQEATPESARAASKEISMVVVIFTVDFSFWPNKAMIYIFKHIHHETFNFEAWNKFYNFIAGKMY